MVEKNGRSLLPRKLSVSGSIPSFSMANDAQRNPYPFSSSVSIMSARTSQ